MKYYIEPAEQTPEVQEQLRAITPTSLNPEEITFLDPACGSAHILVEAYDLFKAIYQERGYRAKDIPRLILGKNLFGLEIDDRAAQLAAFALMMKARADDRRIFDQGIQPQVRALVQTDGMDAEDIAAALNVSASKETPPPGQLFETEDNLFTRVVTTATSCSTPPSTDVKALVDLFEHAKTFGSLIQVPPPWPPAYRRSSRDAGRSPGRRRDRQPDGGEVPAGDRAGQDARRPVRLRGGEPAVHVPRDLTCFLRKPLPRLFLPANRTYLQLLQYGLLP